MVHMDHFISTHKSRALVAHDRARQVVIDLACRAGGSNRGNDDRHFRSIRQLHCARPGASRTIRRQPSQPNARLDSAVSAGVELQAAR